MAFFIVFFSLTTLFEAKRCGIEIAYYVASIYIVWAFPVYAVSMGIAALVGYLFRVKALAGALALLIISYGAIVLEQATPHTDNPRAIECRMDL